MTEIYLPVTLSSMSTVTFDTLKFARRLKDAGISEQHAKAEAAALAELFSEAVESQLSTKADIHRVEKELMLIKWMVGLVIVVEIAPLLTSLL
ncbi:MAG: DUF1640 domain-containing protein [Gammaproteobacteria bacterium]|nr:DUF1640 domain-containing protein [Gammaproteobacteria bacterium]